MAARSGSGVAWVAVAVAAVLAVAALTLHPSRVSQHVFAPPRRRLSSAGASPDIANAPSSARAAGAAGAAARRQQRQQQRHRRLMYRPDGKVAGERVWFVQPLKTVGGGKPTAIGGGGPTDVPTAQAHRWCDRVVDNPVVIVGTDGSGTRVVAKFLAMLNVTMLVERSVYSQMDVDGTSAGVHFTNTIQRVLNHTHSPAYELSDLPADLSQQTLQVLDPFASSMRRNACAALDVPTAADVAQLEGAGAGDHEHEHEHNHEQLWGFKKPDLLNLGPFLTSFFPHVKIVHVVRDGRDMAFSKNQAALHKYADYLYPPGTGTGTSADDGSRESGGGGGGVDGGSGRAFGSLSAEEKKVLLWQKQNHDFAVWGEKLGPDRYHRVRIEDFAATSSGIQLYSNMAVFASNGNPFSATWADGAGEAAAAAKAAGQTADEALLQHAGEVISELHGHSLGSHDSAAGKKAVESQFGKWRALANESMGEHLTALGHGGLSMFGYL